MTAAALLARIDTAIGDCEIGTNHTLCTRTRYHAAVPALRALRVAVEELTKPSDQQSRFAALAEIARLLEVRP